MNINKINLNLLISLDALLTEKQVTRAAERLFITQSAMSSSLNQLRELFQDKLFIRGREAMVPTEKALNIAPHVKRILNDVQNLLSQTQTFDPKISTRCFSLGLSDYAEFVILPRIYSIIKNNAPGVKLKICSLHPRAKLEDFELGNIELGIGAQVTNSMQLKKQLLFTENPICILSKKHKLHNKKLTIGNYKSAEHLVLDDGNGSFLGFSDLGTKLLGQHFQIALTMPHPYPALCTLAKTNLISLIPERIANQVTKNLNLMTKPIPFKTEPVAIYQFWHKRLDEDPGLLWLRDRIKGVCNEI